MFNQRYPRASNHFKDLDHLDLSDTVVQESTSDHSCAFPPNFQSNRCQSPVRFPSPADEIFIEMFETTRPQNSTFLGTPQYQFQRPNDFGKHGGVKGFLNARLLGNKQRYIVENTNHWNTKSYICRLSVAGMDHEAIAEAANKKDAERKAAWNYCEYLIECDLIDEFELPMRPPSLGGISESEIKLIQYTEESHDDIFDHGGWVQANSVKRLSHFCVREDCCADYKQYTTELEGHKTFICDLTLRVSSIQKVVLEHAKDSPGGRKEVDGLCMNLRPIEYSCRESAPTKEVANELCSLNMVRILFAEGLIERFGQPINGQVMGNGPPPIPVMPLNQETTEPIQMTPIKVRPPRKLGRNATTSAASRSRLTGPSPTSHVNEIREDVEVFQNGGWVLSTSLQRLNQFVQLENCVCKFTPMESGADNDITFIHQIYLIIYPINKEYFFTAKENRKKLAKTTCAMLLVRRLFADGFIERFGEPVRRWREVKRDTIEVKRPSHFRYKKRGSNRRRTSPITTPIRYHTQSSPLKRKADTEPEVPVRPKMRRVRVAKPQATPQNSIAHASSPGGKALSVPKDETNPTSDLFPSPIHRTRNLCVILDEYMNEKHTELCPTTDELLAVHAAIQQTDLIFIRTDQEMRMKKGDSDTFMLGIILVGDGSKELLFRHDLNVEMVVICEKIPTKSYFHFVAQILNGKLEEWGKDITSSCKLEEDPVRAALILHFNIHDDSNKIYDVTVTVYVTSNCFRALQKENRLHQLPEDVLDTARCLKALSEVRRAEWFKACASGISACNIVIRILRDMKKRIKAWQALDDWVLELLINNVYNTSPVPISSLTCLLERTFKRIANGLFTSDACRILDPCEDDPTDIIQHITTQERKDLIETAQIALKHLLCCEPHKILQINNK